MLQTKQSTMASSVISLEEQIHCQLLALIGTMIQLQQRRALYSFKLILVMI